MQRATTWMIRKRPVESLSATETEGNTDEHLHTNTAHPVNGIYRPPPPPNSTTSSVGHPPPPPPPVKPLSSPQDGGLRIICFPVNTLSGGYWCDCNQSIKRSFGSSADRIVLLSILIRPPFPGRPRVNDHHPHHAAIEAFILLVNNLTWIVRVVTDKVTIIERERGLSSTEDLGEETDVFIQPWRRPHVTTTILTAGE
uniref:Uncharacterized protein n=1 Tax=Timema douglasi TaxID=61478 RepID=A0A7R8Z9M6_TIMDO|nr:unnamed protein product [Timema douglasi]